MVTDSLHNHLFKEFSYTYISNLQHASAPSLSPDIPQTDSALLNFPRDSCSYYKPTMIIIIRH